MNARDEGSFRVREPAQGTDFGKAVPSNIFFGVYDGHGGDSVSQHLKGNLHHEVKEILLEAIGANTDVMTRRQVIAKSFKDAYAKVNEVCHSLPPTKSTWEGMQRIGT